MNDVLPHMLSENVSYTHTLDESMYGGTLTLGGQEVSFGQVMFGKSDSFAAPIPVMFSFIGAEGKNKFYFLTRQGGCEVSKNLWQAPQT